MAGKLQAGIIIIVFVCAIFLPLSLMVHVNAQTMYPNVESPTNLSFSSNATTIQRSTPNIPTEFMVLSGTLTSNSVPLPNKPIILFIKSPSDPDWVSCGSTGTNASGVYAFYFAADLFAQDTYQFMATFDLSNSDPDYQASNSSVVSVQVITYIQQATTLSSSANATTIQRSTYDIPPDYLNITGTLTSGGLPLGNKPIILLVQGPSDGSWQYMSSSGTNGYGGYMFFFPADTFSVGTYKFIATFDIQNSDQDFESSNSSIMTAQVINHIQQSTVLIASANASIIQRSTPNIPTETVVINGILTSNGTPLANKPVILFIKGESIPDWSFLASTGTNATGQYSVIYPADSFSVGTYQVKATFDLMNTDPDYESSNSSALNLQIINYIKQPTIIVASTNATIIQQSNASNPYDCANITGTLTSNSAPLSSKPVMIFIKGPTDLDFSYFTTVGTDSSGRYCCIVPADLFTGSYQFKATFNLMGSDQDYENSTAQIISILFSPRGSITTTLTVTCSPSTLKVGSSDVATISGILTDGSVELSGKQVSIYLQDPASGIWSLIGTQTTTATGSYQLTYDALGAGKTAGMYQIKASFAGDGTYVANEATCTLIITPYNTDIDIVIVSSNRAHVDHPSTGITVDVNGSSLTDGTSLTITTVAYGSTQPAGTGSITASGNIFYDVQVIPTSGGTLASDVMVTVELTDVRINAGSTIAYWDGANWVTVTSTFIAPHTITFTVSASALTGTPVVVNSVTPFVTPEYPFGALIALIACFVAVIVFKQAKRRPKTVKLH